MRCRLLLTTPAEFLGYGCGTIAVWLRRAVTGAIGGFHGPRVTLRD